MKSTFLQNIIILLILNLIVKPIYLFGIDLKVQNIIGEQEYGQYFELLSLVFIFNIINDLGINVNNTRIVSQDNKSIKTNFRQIIGLKLFLSLVFLLLISLFFFILDYEPASYYMLFIIAIIYITTSYFMFLRSNISGLGLYKTDSLLSVTDRLLLIGIMIYFLYFNALEEFKIIYFLYAQLTSLLITIIIARLLLWNQLQKWSIRFNLLFSIDLLKKSLPYAIVFVLMTVYSRMDGVMLGRLLDDAGREAGIYAAGYRLFDAGAMFAYLFAALLLPMYSRLLKDKIAIQSLSEIAFKLIWIYTVVLVAAFYFYNEEIAILMYTEGDSYYGSIIFLLMISLIGIAVSYIYGTMIVAKGSMSKMNWIFILCIILNFALNYFLIPTYKAYGAAMATVVTQFVAMIGQIIVCHRIFTLKYNYPMYIRSLLYVVVLFAIFYSVNRNIADWTISMSINIILSIIIAFFMKMIHFNELIGLIKTKQQ